MAKKKRKKQNLVPLLAIAIGVYLLTRTDKKVVVKVPDPGTVRPGSYQSQPQVQRLGIRKTSLYI